MLKKYRGIIFLAIILAIAFYAINAYNSLNDKGNVVNVFAGSGKIGAEDGKSLEASFNLPYKITLDRDGGIIVVDSYNNKVRKIKDSKVSTIAGSNDKKDSFGLPKGGYVDDSVSVAKFNRPRSAVVDSKGNIFVADTGNNVIRKITNGKVYTFAGSIEKGYKDGKGSQAKFNTPSGIAIDKNDNIYVADTLNNVIRKISVEGDVTTFAGKANDNRVFQNGTVNEALFNEPEDIAFDSKGIAYVLDTGNQLIRKIENGKVSTLAGNKGDFIPDTNYAAGGFSDGVGDKAKFNFPKGFYVTPEGIIFIADTWNHRIRIIKPTGKVTTIAGSGIAGNKIDKQMDTEFNGPNSILYNNGTLYISDMRNNYIRYFKIDIKKYLK